MTTLALYDPKSELFWNLAPPPTLDMRSAKYWQPVMVVDPQQGSERVIKNRLAAYVCLRDYRPDLPEIHAVKVHYTFTTEQTILDGLDIRLLRERMKACGPRALYLDFDRIPEGPLPTHAVKRITGLGKKVVAQYCPNARHGAIYSFLNETDAVTVRLLASDAPMIDLRTLKRL